MLGLVVDTTKMMVGITPEYLQQVRDLLNNWDSNKRFFIVGNMQKLVGKRKTGRRCLLDLQAYVSSLHISGVRSEEQ